MKVTKKERLDRNGFPVSGKRYLEPIANCIGPLKPAKDSAETDRDRYEALREALNRAGALVEHLSQRLEALSESDTPEPTAIFIFSPIALELQALSLVAQQINDTYLGRVLEQVGALERAGQQKKQRGAK